MLRRFPSETSRVFLLSVLILLLTGCASEYVLVNTADLRALQLRIDEQQARWQFYFDQQLKFLDTDQRQSHYLILDKLTYISNNQQQLMQQQQEWEDFVRSTRFQPLEKEPEVKTRKEKPEKVDQARSAAINGDKQMIGAVEKILLVPPGVILPARIDTGATTSSLDARNIEYFERNGERWVRFVILNPEDDSEVNLERKVVRNVRILQAIAEEFERRPIIELGVTLGKTTQTAYFTLSDRGHLTYPILIGRNILMDIFVVDVSQTQIAPPQPPAVPSSGTGTP